MRQKSITFLCAFSFTFGVLAQTKAAENVFSKQINAYPQSYSYANDYDTSKFRLKISNSQFQTEGQQRTPSSLRTSVQTLLQQSSSQICQAVTSTKDLNLSDSSQYVVSALKKAQAIPADDKNYSLISAHFLWEMYLAYRDFVDISRPIAKTSHFDYSQLPNATIIILEKGCNENGVAAIYCDGKFFAPKFVDLNNFKNRINDPSDTSCKLGQGVRVIAEAHRLK